MDETAEASTAPTLLFALLVGVAPHPVLPTGWALRRTDDGRAVGWRP